MKTIAIPHSKGGVGKSTCINVLAERLITSGQPTRIIDLDPQNDQGEFFASVQEHHPAKDLLELVTLQDVMNRQGTDTDAKTMDTFDEAAHKKGIQLIDSQGSESNLFNLALGFADLILVPMCDSPKEHKGTVATINAIVNTQRLQRRKLNAYFFWNKASGIGISNKGKELEQSLENAGFKLLGRNLMERGPYKKLGETGVLTPSKSGCKSVSEASDWLRSVAKALREEA